MYTLIFIGVGMKLKKIALLFLLTSISSSAFSQETSNEISETETKFKITDYVNFFSPEVHHTSTWSVRATNYNSFVTYTLGANWNMNADMKELKVKSGLDFSYHEFNLSFDAIYAPTLFENYNAGIRLINHYNWFFDEYYEFDFLGGFYFAYRPSSKWELTTSILFQEKIADIYSIYNDIGSLISTCPSLDFSVYWEPCDYMNLTFFLSSFSFYKYFLFYSPDARLTAEFKVNPVLYLSITGEVQFVDFLTLSANFNNLTAIISISWRF